jgi:hypothetical protein
VDEGGVREWREDAGAGVARGGGGRVRRAGWKEGRTGGTRGASVAGRWGEEALRLMTEGRHPRGRQRPGAPSPRARLVHLQSTARSQ